MDYIRARIITDYQYYYRLLPGDCLAAVEWEELAQHPALPHPLNRIMLACLHYAHILSIHSRTDKVTVSALHQAVGALADRLVDGDPLIMTPYAPPTYMLNKGGEQFAVWPWRLCGADEVRAGKKEKHAPGFGVREYVATLNDRPGDMFGIHLKMAMGLENVLAPGSAMFLLWILAFELDHSDQVLIGQTLRRMHEYYQTVAPYTKFLGAAKAVNSAMGYPKRAIAPADAGNAHEQSAEFERRRIEAYSRGQRKAFYTAFWGGLAAISVGAGVLAACIAWTADALFKVAVPGGPLLVWLLVSMLVFLANRGRIGAGLRRSLARLEQEDQSRSIPHDG